MAEKATAKKKVGYTSGESGSSSSNSSSSSGTILDKYIKTLTANQNPYTAMTEAEIEAAAKNRYKSVYDQKRLDAQQSYDAATLARQQQIGEANAMYDEQIQQSAKNYANQQAQAQRASVGRGMQRSSYTGATVANIGVRGNEAAQAIEKNRASTLSNLSEEQKLASSQLAKQLAQFNSSELSDRLAYQDELEAREYDRQISASERQNQIAEAIYNARLYATQNNLFGMGTKSSGSSGGYSSSYSGGSSYRNNNNNNNNNSKIPSIFDLLNGSNSAIANAIKNTTSGNVNNNNSTAGGKIGGYGGKDRLKVG